MESSSKIEIERFNGQNWELWKIKIEDILIYQEQWTSICLGTQLIGMSMEEWEKLERKERKTIRLCLPYSVLLNVLGEDSVKNLWENMGSLY
jgi:hypothetical protein